MRLALILWLCASAASLQAAPGGIVVFSELMWMGSTASAADEWIELYNRSDSEVDLDGWTITRLASQGEEVMLRLEKARIGPHATFLIANYPADSPHSRLAATPDRVDAAISLPNTKLQLRLYDGPPDEGGKLIDVADDGTGVPLAGDPDLKRAMVRIAFDRDGTLSTSWTTAVESAGWDPGATEAGTPGSIPERLRPTSSSALPSTAAQAISWAAVKRAP